MATFVLVPGACHGGWYYTPIIDRLREEGHRVHSLTPTGVAERAHAAAAGVNLDTHIEELVGLLAAEQIRDAVLVGHSYGGMMITGAADRAPERVDALVYLDAFVPRHGDSCLKLVTDEMRAWYFSTPDGLTIPPLSFFDERATAHPLATLLQPIRLNGDLNRFRRRDYVYAKDWGDSESPLATSYTRVAEDPAWTTHALDARHDLLRDAPDEILKILLEAARG
jgi:pimeloyl-ACP methyl ester carboxylesterase